jgi:hypothetical protein
MVSIFQSPLGLLFAGLGLFLLPQILRVGRAGVLAAEHDGILPFFMIFMLAGVLVVSLVTGL